MGKRGQQLLWCIVLDPWFWGRCPVVFIEAALALVHQKYMMVPDHPACPRSSGQLLLPP